MSTFPSHAVSFLIRIPLSSSPSFPHSALFLSPSPPLPPPSPLLSPTPSTPPLPPPPPPHCIKVLDELLEQLKESLSANQFERVRFFVRFLADLVNTRVLDVESIVEVFDALLAVKFELAIPQVCVHARVRVHACVRVCMHAWCGYSQMCVALSHFPYMVCL